MLANYRYEIKKSTIFFTHSDSQNKIDMNVIENSNCMHVIIDDIYTGDLDFIKKLMKIVKTKDYFNFFLIGKNSGQELLAKLSKLSTEVFGSSFMPKMVFSLFCALNFELNDDDYVGTIVQNDDCIYAQPINGATLKYKNLKKAKLLGKKLAQEILALNLSTPEQIIWIDNWFQKNIQYIKDAKTVGFDGKTYVCDKIHTQAVVEDVFTKNYGVCEDISTSIAIVLNELGIQYEEVAIDDHAWIIVAIDNKYYIWDCTHNITRNNNLAVNGIKATKYSNGFTLLGKDKSNGKYKEISGLPKIEKTSYPDNLIEKAIDSLKELNVSFDYDKKALYSSQVVDNLNIDSVMGIQLT